MSYLLLCGMFGVGAGAIAHDKGRGVYGWMLAGVLVGPLALAVVLLPAGKRGCAGELDYPTARNHGKQGDRSWCTSSLL